MIAVRADRPGRGSVLLGAAVAAAFTFAVVGSNIPGPILPLYEDHLGLSPFVLAALFVTYFVALVSMFLLVSRTSLGRFAWAVLPGALVVGLLGDVALWSGADTAWLLFVGRALTGTCVGLATGSAATLAVAARGDAGRTLAATGAIAGSFLGLVAAATVAQLLPEPTVLIYRLHAVSLVLSGLLLAAALWRSRRRLAALRHDEPSRPPGPLPSHPDVGSSRNALPAYGLGAAGWTVGGIAVGVLPSALRDGIGSELLVIGVLAAIILLVTAWLGPYVARAAGRTPGPGLCLLLLAGGGVLVAAGLLAHTLWPVLAGSFLWGIGQGFAYAQGLILLTAGMTPVEQGRSTSLYACSSYGFAAVMILVAGALSSAWGYSYGSAGAVTIFVLFCVAVAAAGRGRWAPAVAVAPVAVPTRR
ncbi:quinolone resistance protein norA [Rhodococcus sp. AH-ZY2]|uniref:quinolone resistance protein norA n=1 Tax=Rhodococcus sp. AH-ZY2 TaxID=3047468 RepID=UPI0027E1D23C|nr:quinolone resistance protein norA [Rhodococcus sp. AH-ZY2]WML62472.1 quinolone resistance protein norA [Rhodococcus sp. AH-ZY2]